MQQVSVNGFKPETNGLKCLLSQNKHNGRGQEVSEYAFHLGSTATF